MTHPIATHISKPQTNTPQLRSSKTHPSRYLIGNIEIKLQHPFRVTEPEQFLLFERKYIKEQAVCNRFSHRRSEVS